MTVLPWLCGALSLALGATAATCAVLATRLRGATGGSPPESPEMTAPMEEPPPAIGDGEPFLRDIVEGSADGVHVLDLDGHVLFSSRSGLALLQSGSDGPCLGRSFVDLWPRCERDEVLGRDRGRELRRDLLFLQPAHRRRRADPPFRRAGHGAQKLRRPARAPGRHAAQHHAPAARRR